MPIVAPMKTLSGPEFNSWYTKNRKGSGLTDFMSLSKEDRKKAREYLKEDLEEEKKPGGKQRAEIMAMKAKLFTRAKAGESAAEADKFIDTKLEPKIRLYAAEHLGSGAASEMMDEIIDELREIYKGRKEAAAAKPTSAEPPSGPTGTKYHLQKIKDIGERHITAAKRGEPIKPSFIFEIEDHVYSIQDDDQPKVEKLIASLRNKIAKANKAK